MPIVIILDIIGVLVGTSIGCLFKKSISPKLNESMNLALAVVSAGIGIQLLGRAVHMPAAVLALLIGGLAGHILGIDKKLSLLSQRLPASGGESARILMVAFTLYCLSTTGVIGALNLGFTGETTVLATKAIMDLMASVFFAAQSGWILSLIAVPLGLILFLLWSVSGVLMPHLTAEMIGDFSACGGLIQLMNALRIAKLRDPPVADYMPALLLVFGFSTIWANIM